MRTTRTPTNHLLRALQVIVALALPCVAPMAAAQDVQTGAVTGQVSDTRSTPLANATVRVDGTRLGGVTDADGRYRIVNVPAGSRTIVIVRLGYSSQRIPVTVNAGAETAVNAQLQAGVVALEEVIVTGTAGMQERRAIGNAVATISAGDELAKSAAPDMTNLLRGRAPGLDVLQTTARVGAGPSIQIRGASSMALGNTPLIYIDGIRVDNATGRTIQGAGGLGTQNASVGTRLNDIAPQDIESIEIIKGPAAGTIYGTEGTNGVVHIITKKGHLGRLNNVRIENGVMRFRDYLNRMPTNLMDSSGTIVGWNGAKQEADSGRPLFRTGQERRYNASASGGRDQMRYYLSVGYQNDFGVEPNNSIRQATTHANVTAPAGGNSDVNVSLNFINSAAHLGADAGASAMLNTIAGHRRLFPAFRGFFAGPPEVPQTLYDNYSGVYHFTGGVTLNNALASWFNQRAIVGLDYTGEDARALERFAPPALTPFLSVAQAAGRIGQTLRRNTVITTDYSGTATYALTPMLSTSTSIGGQFNKTQFNSSFLGGQGFAGPGLETVSSTATAVAASQSAITNTTIGAYLQEQLAWRDRLFVTAAFRVDNNSAFGEDFDWVTYPKAGLSWVVSDESFFKWTNIVRSLRLRTAYGESGRQPQAFSALRTFSPIVGPGGTNAVTPNSLGNPELKPERGKEWEIGFEASVFDRFSLDFTHFSKKTMDAIVNQPVPPSSGFSGSRVVNLGQVNTTGIEVRATYDQPITNTIDWGVTLNVGTVDNTIKKNITSVIATAGAANIVGYPINGLWVKKVVAATYDPATRTIVPASVLCDGGPGAAPVACATAPFVFSGPSTPTMFGSLANTIRIGKSLQLYGLLDTRRGNRLFNQNETIRCLGLTGGRFCEANHYPERFDPKLLANYLPTALGAGTIDQLFQDASFIKLRELSATYQVPQRFVRKFSAASITLAGRELATWTDYRGFDPESAVGTGGSFADQAILPPLTRFVATLNLSW
ncbi:MAG: SusC/RagA family TonB-linked outer membrane protein [Gemmatimonadaceae bacterium]